MSGLGNKEIMARNIQYYMALKGKSRKEVCEAIGVKYTTFTDWVKGSAYPRIDKIELMAQYFGITKSDLVEEDRFSDVPTLSPDESDLVDTYRQLTSPNQKKVTRYASALLDTQEGDLLMAAHKRTDIEPEPEDEKFDEEIMKNF